MINFIYTLTPDAKENLIAIDNIRSAILIRPIPPKVELQLKYQATIELIYGGLRLSGIDLSRKYILDIITSPPKRPTLTARDILGYRNALNLIYSSWVANTKPISITTLESLANTAFLPDSKRIHSELTTVEKSLHMLFSWIGTNEDHPVVQAAIIHSHLSRFLHTETKSLTYLMSFTALAKFGYHIRGMLSIDNVLADNQDSYARALKTIDSYGQITAWLEFYIKTTKITIEKLYERISGESVRINNEMPIKNFDLSERQISILKLLDNPSLRISNSNVQKRFKVSQITASRDLSKLTSIGLLYSHGKGRSVYYTRVSL